ncbi:MAG: hypothetical protein ACTSRX_02665 [Promethearchaeota archaeon]
MNNNPLFKLKIAICGDYDSVRSLMNQFNPNLREYTKFMGFSNATKLVRTEKFNAKFLIWSKENSRFFNRSNFFSGSLGCIIPVDLTNRNIFNRVIDYRSEFRGMPTFLVNNKANLLNENVIENEETEKISEDLADLMRNERDLHYAEINTNTGAGIDELFEELAKKIISEQNYF